MNRASHRLPPSLGEKDDCRSPHPQTHVPLDESSAVVFPQISFHLGAMALAGMLLLSAIFPARAWEPTQPIQIIVPAGTGGGADQMARIIQAIVAKRNLARQQIEVINEGNGSGGEGFLDVKNSRGDAHKLIITLSNLFTTPLATGMPFSWRDITPVAMMALDEFVLWVHANTPYKTAQNYIAAIKAAPDGQFKMGGTGSKQEDQIITAAIEKATGTKMTYIPFKGGGAVAAQLAARHVDSTVNNPIEAVAEWRARKVRPLCVFDATGLTTATRSPATCRGTIFRPARRRASTSSI